VPSIREAEGGPVKRLSIPPLRLGFAKATPSHLPRYFKRIAARRAVHRRGGKWTQNKNAPPAARAGSALSRKPFHGLPQGRSVA
jgi:hypothetical protein